MKVVTNNADFAKYLQSKFVECYLSNRENVFPDAVYVVFDNCRNSSVCGNRFNQRRLENGTMKADFENLLKYFKVKHLVMVTPITHFGGKLMREHYPILQDYYDAMMMQVKKTRINSSQLGELLLPRMLNIYTKGVPQLKPITDKIIEREMIRVNGKNQCKFDLDVINATTDKDERSKLRYFPEYAVYSQIYHQILEVLNGTN